MRISGRMISLYALNRSVIMLLILLVALEVLFVFRLLWPAALNFVIEKHIFEIIVLFSIMQLLLMMQKILEQRPRRFCKNEHECQELLRAVVRRDPRARSLHILSAGIGTRFDLITTIADDAPGEFSTELLAQSPKSAPDREDAKRLEATLKILDRREDIPLECRFFTTPASIRALILCDASRAPLWCAASWYRYVLDGEDVRLIGRRNPAIIFSAEQPEDVDVLTFLMGVFEEAWGKGMRFYPKDRSSDVVT